MPELDQFSDAVDKFTDVRAFRLTCGANAYEPRRTCSAQAFNPRIQDGGLT
jgi:hypothetical protein